MIIFLRLRKSPQTPKKKSVKETPKYLKASIGIVYFYANSTPFVLQANIFHILAGVMVVRSSFGVMCYTHYLGQSSVSRMIASRMRAQCKCLLRCDAPFRILA